MFLPMLNEVPLPADALFN